MLQAAVASIAAATTVDKGDSGTEGQRWPSVENRWPTIDVILAKAIERLNSELAPIALRIAPPGETNWSLKNRGFGAFRRLEINGKSVAWLRTEINQEQVLTVKVRAHDAPMALLNATTQAQALHLDQTQALEALATVIRPAAEFAAWNASHKAADGDGTAAGWREVAKTASDAFSIASGALREVGARLTEAQAPTWDPASGQYRWLLAVMVQGVSAADISVDLVRRGLEIASATPADRRSDLTRKRRLDLDGMTPHGLAEAIAACAWPAVADALERSSAASSTE